MGGPLALDGCHLMWGHNTQPKVIADGEGGVREETRPGRNLWGMLSHCLGRPMELGLGHSQPLIEHFTHNNQPKTGVRDGGEYEGEVGHAGGAGEARCHRFGGALKLMDVKNYYKIVEFTNYFFLARLYYLVKP